MQPRRESELSYHPACSVTDMSLPLFTGIWESQCLLITTLVKALVCSLRVQVADLRHIYHRYHPAENLPSNATHLLTETSFSIEGGGNELGEGHVLHQVGQPTGEWSGAPRWATSSTVSSSSKPHAWSTKEKCLSVVLLSLEQFMKGNSK